MRIKFFSLADNQPQATPVELIPTLIEKRKNQYVQYSQQEDQFMRDNWQTMTTGEIAQALGRSRSSVSTYAWRVLKLRKTKEAKFMAASKGQVTREDAYSETERQYLRDNWQTKTIKQMAAALGRTTGSVKSQGQKKMGLRKSPEAISALGKRPNAGQFKKGNLPANTVYGDEMVIRIRFNYQRKHPTKYIRLGLGKWQEYQHYIWEQANGPVPKGMILAFVNGDRMDCRLENLKLITKGENAIRNSGSLNLADGFVAHALAWHDPQMQNEMLKHPELIELKRTQLQLKRALENDDTKPTKTRRSRKRHDR